MNQQIKALLIMLFAVTSQWVQGQGAARIDDRHYTDLKSAIDKAREGDIVYLTLGQPYSLPAIPVNITIAVDEGVTGAYIQHTSSGNIASIPNGVTFKNLEFRLGNVNYHGFQHAGHITMEGCTIKGRLCSYGDMTFDHCQFVQENSDYHMWCYSGNITYDYCTFTNSATGKFLNIYNESGATKYTVTTNNCRFINSSNSSSKAALNVKSTCSKDGEIILLAYDVIINNCSTQGSFPAASSSDNLVVFNSVVQVDDRPAGTDNITVTQDNVLIYPIPEPSVAQIGTTGYPTLQAAVNAAQQLGGAQTITIIDNISGETVTIPEVANFQLTIDGQKDEGYTIDAAIIVDGLRSNGGSTTNGASVTLQNIAFVQTTTTTDGITATHYPHNLTIQDCTYSSSDNSKWFLNANTDGPLYGVTVKNVTVEHARLIYGNLADDAVFQNITATNDVTAGFNVKTSGTALIENCEVTTGKYAFRDYGDTYAGTFTLKNNTFVSTTTGSDEGVIVNRGGAVGTAHINVESGTYTGHVKVISGKEGVLAISGGYFSEEFPQSYIAADLVAQGKVCVPATDKEGYFTIGDPHYVAQIGDVKFVSLAAAVEAAQANDVITMIDDDNVSLTAAGSEIIIDKPLTITGAVDETGKPKFTIFGSTNGELNNDSFNDLLLKSLTGTVTVSNVKFDGFGNEISSVMGHSPLFIGSSNQNAVIENVYISNLNCEGIHINGGTFTINNCNIDCSKTTDAIFTKGICVVNAASGTIENTTITGVDCNDPNDTSAAIETQGSGEIAISGCTIQTNTIGIANTPVGTSTAGTSQVTVSDCTIESHNIAVYGNGEKGAMTYITSGLYSGLLMASDDDEGLAISGGLFDDEPELAYCAEGYAPAENTDAATMEAYPYTVVELPDVAQIGDVKYKSLAAAVAAVPEGTQTTIVMIDNETINTNEGVTIPANKNVVLDLNGKTITGVVQSPSNAQTILNKGTLTIIDGSDEQNGTLTNEVSDENAGSPGNDKNWFSNVISNNGNLTVNSGNIVNTGTGGACYAIDNISNGTLCTPVLNIAGGNISADKVAVRMFCNSTTNDNTLNMTGGVVSGGARGIQTQIANKNPNKATLNISGGYVNGGTYAWLDTGYNQEVTNQYDNVSYSITGGFFSGDMWSSATYYRDMEGFVSGGYFDTIFGGDILAPGMACIDNTDEATMATYPYTIGQADVFYYWLENNKKVGGYYTIYAPFAGPDPVLMDGEFVELQRNVTLTKDIEYIEEVSFGNPIFKGGTFTLTFGEYDIDLNGHAFPIPTGVTILTDKQTDIFSALDADYKVVEETTETGYAYTVVAKDYVAQIGNVKYETLQTAVDAAEDGATIEILKDFELKTVTTNPNNKYNVNINKSVTIDGKGYTITSSQGKRALALTGEGNVITLKDLTVVNNKADWVIGITDNLTCTLDNTTIDANNYVGDFNQPITVGAIDGNGRVTLNVTNGSIIKTNDEGTAHYSIILWHPADITVTDSKLIGWGNIYIKPDAEGSTVTINGSEMMSKGISGNSNNFAVIVAECGNNTITVTDTKITTAPAADTYQSLVSLNGTGNVVKFLGSTTYTTSDMHYGAATFNWSSLKDNKLYFDDTTKAAFEQYFDGSNNAVIDDETDETNLYPVNFSPDILYYWATNNGYQGGYYNFAQPFEEGWLDDGEFIALQKDITLTKNIACQLTDGQSFNFLLGDYAVTKGDYSVSLNLGVTVNTDKQTDIFSSAAPDYKVVEEVAEEGSGYNYVYSLVAKDYVAQIGDVKYETLEAAWNAVEDGETITLLADCSGNGLVAPQGKFTTGLTVDFAGFTYTVDGATVGSSGTQTQAFQLLKDNTITFQNGTIYSEKAKILVQNYSDLTLEGMTLTMDNENYTSAYTLSNNNGTVVIDGTTINANPAGGFAFDVCRYSSYPSVNVTVTGNSVINGDVEVYASGSNAMNGFSLMLDSGTMTGDIVLDPTAEAAMASTPDIAKVSKNDNFDQDPPEGYKWVSNNDGTSTLAPCEYVAQIGNVKYESLAEAVAAVPTDGTETTITMIADANPEGINGATIAATQNVKLDLNGKTITLNINQAKASQLITNKGTLTIVDSSDEQTGKLTNTAAEGVSVGNWPEINFATNIITNSGTLNVEGGTIQNTANGSICYAIDNNSTAGNAILNFKGGTATSARTVIRQFCNSTTLENTVNISGGSIVTNASTAMWTQLPGSNSSSKKKATLNITGGEIKAANYAWYDYSFGDSFEAVKYSITGGQLTGIIESDALLNGIIDGFVSGGLFSEEVDASYIVEGYKCVPYDADPSWYTIVPKEYVAKIGDVKYESLAEAIAAVGDGETITMLCNVDNAAGIAVPEGKNFTVDFAGYTYTLNKPGAGSTGTETIGFQLLKNSTIVFKNGTINISEDNLTAAVAPAKNIMRIIQNYANLTLEDMTIDGTNQYGEKNYVVSFNNGTSSIIGNTSITAGEQGQKPIIDVYLNNYYTGTNLTINTTGVLGGDIETCAVSESQANACSLTITNADVKGTVTKSGNYDIPVSVSGGIYDEEVKEEYCAEGYICVQLDNGRYTVSTPEDAGIYELVDNETYKYPEGVVGASKVTYKRTFDAKIRDLKYQSWQIPMDYTVKEEDAEYFEFFKIHMIAGAEEPGEVEDVSKIYIYITKVEPGTTLKGNRPYVIKPIATLPFDYEFVQEDVDLLAKDETSRKHLETSEYAFDFYGVYEDYTTTTANECYTLNKVGGIAVVMRAGTTLTSYRWIMKATPKEDADDYTNFNFVITDGEPEVDAISEQFIDTDREIESIYTIDGRKLDHVTKGLNVIKYTDGTTEKVYIKK